MAIAIKFKMIASKSSRQTSDSKQWKETRKCAVKGEGEHIYVDGATADLTSLSVELGA
jgi:hypothetical protein